MVAVSNAAEAEARCSSGKYVSTLEMILLKTVLCRLELYSGEIAVAAVDLPSRRQKMIYHKGNNESKCFRATLSEFILISSVRLD